MQPQRAVFRLVVDEQPLPGQKSLVFKTLDGLARTETHIAGKNIHQFVLRVSCPIGLVLADRQGRGQPWTFPGNRAKGPSGPDLTRPSTSFLFSSTSKT